MPFRAQETTQSYGQAGPRSVWLKGSFPLRRNTITVLFLMENVWLSSVDIIHSFTVARSSGVLEKARHGGTLAESKA